MSNISIGKIKRYLPRVAILGTLILVIMLMIPAVYAEDNTLGISIVEQINRADQYHPNVNGLTGGALTPGTVSGTGTVTLTNNADMALTDINVQFVQGSTSEWALSTTPDTNKVTVGTVNAAGGVVTVHIPLLDVGQHAIVTYSVSDTVDPPVYLTASYADNKIIALNGANTTVTLTATRDNDAIPAGDTITDVEATSVAETGLSLSTTTFEFSDLTAAAPTDAKTTVVTVTDATEFNGVNQMNEYLMATTSLSYVVQSATQTISGVSVSTATAKTPNILWDIQKELSSGSWVFTPKVDLQDNEDTITYELTAVTVWVTSNSDLNTELASQVYDSGTLPADLTTSGSWTGAAWTWDPGLFSGVPVGFVKPSINVKYTSTQFPVVSGGSAGYRTTDGGSTSLAKYIYIVNGYLIEVTKVVTPVSGSPGQYDVTITVTNKGSKAASNVIVYDIVANTFTMNAGSDNPDYAGSTAVSIQGITGIAYWWNFDSLPALTGSGTITYRITAVDEDAYPLTDVFLVGVDPAQSLNLQSTPFIHEANLLAAINYESLAALGVACLFMVGMFGVYRRKQ